MSETRKAGKVPKKTKPKAVTFWVDSDGVPYRNAENSPVLWGFRKFRYVPRDSSAEGRAARYERALRKIAKHAHSKHPSAALVCIHYVVKRALAKEERP